MNLCETNQTIGVLLSGGLDSSILVARLLEQGSNVQPFYIRSHLVWEADELSAVRRFLASMASRRLRQLVTLELPLADLYGDHWSVTGRSIPNADTPDEAVFLPGRNALLVIKAALWCQLNNIHTLALAPLGTSPFEDAKDGFFEKLQDAINGAGQPPLSIIRPFIGLNKLQVMQLANGAPLELTFSCIAPRGGKHCGDCNKCAERRSAFRAAERSDPTDYATSHAIGQTH